MPESSRNPGGECSSGSSWPELSVPIPRSPRDAASSAEPTPDTTGGTRTAWNFPEKPVAHVGHLEKMAESFNYNNGENDSDSEDQNSTSLLGDTSLRHSTSGYRAPHLSAPNQRTSRGRIHADEYSTAHSTGLYSRPPYPDDGPNQPASSKPFGSYRTQHAYMPSGHDGTTHPRARYAVSANDPVGNAGRGSDGKAAVSSVQETQEYLSELALKHRSASKRG